MRKAIGIALVFLLTASAFPQQLTHKLTNQDVIDMVRLGLSDTVVIEKIQTSNGTDFDTSVKGLTDLKMAHVSDAIIRVMIEPHQFLSAPRDGSKTMPDDNLPSEVGVYVVNEGRLMEIEPEIVGWQTGGVLKRMGTLGIDKGHTNGTVMHATSSVRLASPAEFVIRAPEGTAATEYQLLRLYQKGNRREFRAVTGGVFHASSGTKRNVVAFDPIKIGSYTWKFTVALPKGEYGLLPPGVSAASIASAGKVYSFTIIEGEMPAAGSPTGTRYRSRGQSLTQAEQDEERMNELWGSQRTAAIVTGPQPQPAPGPKSGERAWLGASSADTPQLRHNGVTLSGVDPESPASKAGLRAGDVILTLDGKYIYTIEELSSEIQKRTPGSRISIGFMRGTVMYDTTVVLGRLGSL